MINNIKNTFLLILIFTLTACGGGGSSSGGEVQVTPPGQSLPPEFVGVYRGTLNVRAEALGISESDSFPITITVSEDGTIRFDGDDPDEAFTVGIANDGQFSGSLTITEDECSGTISVTGQVNGTTASGDVQGDGQCSDGNITVDVTLTGDFSATK